MKLPSYTLKVPIQLYHLNPDLCWRITLEELQKDVVASVPDTCVQLREYHRGRFIYIRGTFVWLPVGRAVK